MRTKHQNIFTFRAKLMTNRRAAAVVVFVDVVLLLSVAVCSVLQRKKVTHEGMTPVQVPNSSPHLWIPTQDCSSLCSMCLVYM